MSEQTTIIELTSGEVLTVKDSADGVDAKLREAKEDEFVFLEDSTGETQRIARRHITRYRNRGSVSGSAFPP